MRKYIILTILLSCLHIAARGQTIASLDDIDLSGLPKPTAAKQLRYWFDDDGSVKTTTQLKGTQTLDASALTEGLHTVHYQVVDEKNAMASVSSALFMKLNSQASATAAKQLRYWFDDDDGSVKTTTQLKGTQPIDASALTEGLHTLHYQVVGEKNAVASVSSALFMKLSSQASATAAKQLRYWFDDDAATLKTITATGGVQTLDASSLMDGLHTVHYQVVGSDNTAYHIVSALFMKMGGGGSETVTAKKLMYWFDDETAITTVDVSGGVQLLDASRLADGLHTLHFQVLCSNGMLTSATSVLFMRMNIDAQATTARQLRYWFDDAQTATTASITAGATTLDAKQLAEGLHTVHYQIVDSRGAVCPPSSALFMKMDAATQATQVQRLRYWFDDDATTLKVIDVAKGTQTLDVSTLLTGLHTLCYQLVDSEGKVSTPYTRLFMKAFDKVVPDGQNRVVKYQYWLNSNSQNMQTVTLNAAANPYTLISLLPMPKEPIHSDCFHFEMTNGKPTVYAKNIFHIRFHDAAGYFADGDRPFIDYSVKQEVTGAELLNNGDHKDTARPVDNDIKWYRLTAEPGDSVQFRLDRAATVQLFAPSGEEVLSASASDVVKWFGCHVRETGTYYLALHDVTATQGTTVGIDYEHIDKYAVLRQDVTLVGNGGCSTITFEGNGFRDLYAVDLFTEQGDSVHHVYIGHESDATTSVVFDFTNAALGTYHAKFRFAEEDKVFNGLVTVEEARDIELATTVTYPSTFLQGTSTTYTIKIDNKGNMTAYAVPIEMHIFTQNISDIKEIRFDGYIDDLSFPDVLQTDSIDEEAIEMLMECFKSASGLSQFVCYHDSTGSGDFALSHAILTIPPGIAKQITVTLKSNSSITFEAYVNKEWFPITITNDGVALSRMKNSSMRESMCCMRTKVECVADIVVNIASPLMPPGANCLTSLSKTGLETLYDVWCSEGANMSERFDNYLKSEGQNLANRLLESAISCVTGYYGKWLKELRNDRVMAAKIGNVAEVERLTAQIQNVRGALNGALKALYDGLSTLILGKGCVDAFTNPLPGCPPDPGGGGGPSTPVASMDPNDIYGYTAESGSHAVKDGLTDVYYRIEFENDTAFATASAHDIYVTDTLDASKFDLSTFKPTRVRIGEKTAELTGEQNFVTTVDMRPEINAIAQVEGTYDEKKGIVRWHISSLDPMTMEPTKYVQDGVLPVNVNGKGIGELMFDIALKPGLAHGTEIKNRAGIVFDTNDVIMTPTWTNTIDRVRPVSRVVNAELLPGGNEAAVSIEASDEGSGPWRYDVYVQYGSGAWFLAAEGVSADTTATVKLYDGIVHRFYSVATDKAGNVEAKEAHAELTLTISERQKGDVNGDGHVDVADIASVITVMAGGSGLPTAAADVNGDGQVDVADIATIISIMAELARMQAAVEE